MDLFQVKIVISGCHVLKSKFSVVEDLTLNWLWLCLRVGQGDNEGVSDQGADMRNKVVSL